MREDTRGGAALSQHVRDLLAFIDRIRVLAEACRETDRITLAGNLVEGSSMADLLDEAAERILILEGG